MHISNTGKRLRLPAVFLSLPVVIHSSMAPAATPLHWNVGGTGGDGIWGTGPGDKNWNVTAGAPAGNVAWPGTGDETAVFQDALGGTVTVFDPVLASGLVQNGANYTITAGEITLVRDAALTAPFIQVNAGTLTLESSLFGTDGLVKSGTGELVLSGEALYTGTTTISAGKLTLGGALTSANVVVSSGATLEVQSGGLVPGSFLENSGTLVLGTSDSVGEYRSMGGRLAAGAGSLSATTALLGDGSVVEGMLGAGVLTTQGNVAVSGLLTGGNANIASGTLVNTGIFGDAAMTLNISGGATLVAGGIQQYAQLSTSGAGAGVWQGNLLNSAIVTPGGDGGFGTLAVDGNFTNLNNGTLRIDLGAGDSDLIGVSGTATFGGTLDLSQAGVGPVPTLTPIQVVQAANYAGNFSSITEDLDGAVFFNPLRGEVTLLGGANGGLPGGPGNRRSTWISLYDDVIEPGVRNVVRRPGGGLELVSGVADTENPELLWALTASMANGRLNGQVLDRLSPAPYAGLSDYALQASRRHEATARSAPSLVSGTAIALPQVHEEGKGGSAKDGLAPVASVAHRWEFFAAADVFQVELDDLPADFNLKGWGVTAGWRFAPVEPVRLAAYLAVDEGDVSGSLIDADATGWSLGLMGEYMIHRPSETRITAGWSWGDQEFDGGRGGLTANAAGWSPVAALFSDVNVTSWSGFVEIAGTAWRDQRFQLVPNASLRYAASTMDSFLEGGSAVGLAVFEDQRDTLIFEAGLDGVMKVNDKLTATARGGLRQGVIDDPVVLGARFLSGSRPMRAEVDGLSGNSAYLGFGMNLRTTEAIAVGLDYEAEIRTDANVQHGAALSATWRF